MRAVTIQDEKDSTGGFTANALGRTERMRPPESCRIVEVQRLRRDSLPVTLLMTPSDRIIGVAEPNSPT